MRIKEQIKEFGYFWLPSSPEKKVPGVLHISTNAEIKLEVWQFPQKNLSFSEEEKILGFIDEHRDVTLIGCYWVGESYQERDIWNGNYTYLSKIKVKAHIALFGPHYHEENIFLNSFSFSLDYLAQWVGLDKVVKTEQQFGEKQQILQTSLVYSPPHAIRLNLNNDMKLGIGFGHDFNSSESSVGIKPVVSFSLYSDNKLPLRKLLSFSHQINAFVCFALGRIVGINDSVRGTLKSDVEGEKPRYFSLYFGSTLNLAEDNYDESFHLFAKGEPTLFGYKDIEGRLEDVVKKWLDAYSEFGHLLDLYLHTIKGDFTSEVRFLSLCQVLGGYHRRAINKNLQRTTFRKRLEQLIELFEEFLGENEQKKILISDVVNTRNYLTHFNKSLESKALKEIKLMAINDKMDALFRLHLLDLLGFSRSEIKLIYEHRSYLKSDFQGTSRFREITM